MVAKATKKRRAVVHSGTPGLILQRLERLQRNRVKNAENQARNIEFARMIRHKEAQATARIEHDQITGMLPEVRANNRHRAIQLESRLDELNRLLGS